MHYDVGAGLFQELDAFVLEKCSSHEVFAIYVSYYIYIYLIYDGRVESDGPVAVEKGPRHRKVRIV